MQPLQDLKVLDLTTLLPGPLASLMLRECGAEVVKIEAPSGDGMRRLGLGEEADEALFALLNAGKRAVTLDLKNGQGKQRFLDLAKDADIVMEQFRPGVMNRLGLGFRDLERLNPRLIYCSISGYGQDGPLAQRAGHDLNYLAHAGILALSPGSDEAPTVPPVLAADIAAGSYPAFFNILLAVIDRQRTGRGQHLDIAMTDGLFPFGVWALAKGWGSGEWPLPGAELLTGGSPRYRLYKSRDGVLVSVAAIEDKFWAALCQAVGLPESLRGPEADQDAVIAELARAIAARDATHWRDTFAEADCCCCVVADLRQAVADPHFVRRNLFSRSIMSAAGARLPALPLPIAPSFRGSPDELPAAPPPDGSHG